MKLEPRGEGLPKPLLTALPRTRFVKCQGAGLDSSSVASPGTVLSSNEDSWDAE